MTNTPTTPIKPQVMDDAATRQAWSHGNNQGKGYYPGADLMEACGIERDVAERWAREQRALGDSDARHWPAGDVALLWTGLADDEGVIHVLGWSHGPWCVDVQVDDDGTARPA